MTRRAPSSQGRVPMSPVEFSLSSASLRSSWKTTGRAPQSFINHFVTKDVNVTRTSPREGAGEGAAAPELGLRGLSCRQSDLKIKIAIDLTVVWALLDHEAKKTFFFASCD